MTGPSEDVVVRARAALEAGCGCCDNDQCGWRDMALAEECRGAEDSTGLVPELVAELVAARAEVALTRDGFQVRPMTETESNLMTQVLELRAARARVLAVAREWTDSDGAIAKLYARRLFQALAIHRTDVP